MAPFGSYRDATASEGFSGCVPGFFCAFLEKIPTIAVLFRNADFGMRIEEREYRLMPRQGFTLPIRD
jgi:hypothetical protein